jgi:ABC-type multidrug transport system ATPase subunit
MNAGEWPEIRCTRGASLRVRLPPGKAVRIGPSYTAELCLPAAPASGTISWTDDGVILEPEAGSDGFEIAGVAIAGRLRLDHGAEIQLGAYLLELSWQTAESAAGVVADRAVKADDRAHLLAGGMQVSRVLLRQGVSIGSDSTCDYQVTGAGTPAGRRAYCVTVAENPRGFEVEASGFEERGVLLNGQLFSRRELVLGDYLQIGPLCFRYDGEGGLIPCANSLGASLDGRELAVTFDSGAKWILDGASLRVPAGHFVGILGPSGSGKTTLLKVVSGLLNMARGEVLLDGRPIPSSSAERRSLIGFVPQDDIVHPDLTVHQALRYGARLRLADSVPDHEIEKLIERMVGRIFFQWRDRDFENKDPEMMATIARRNSEMLAKRVGQLSGGQRKRVSVAVELMSRPRILFLDEPTSGLDPASEQELMSMLRDVTNSGCSVVCTTHVLENVWRMHGFAVVFGGKVVFQGDSAEARSHFGVQDLSTIYQLLERSPGRWQAVPPVALDPAFKDLPAPIPPSAKNPLRQGLLLVHRQFELLKRDRASIALLVGQPLLIGVVLGLVSVDEAAIPYKLFFWLVVAFWFGCSNTAPQIVREKAILDRERGVGLGLAPYLAAKFLFFGTLTMVQVIVLWLILSVPWYPDVGTYPAGGGFIPRLTGGIWQALGATGIALCATAWGLAVSAWARRADQASFVVPLLVIPQILFSGFVFPLDNWQNRETDTVRAKAGKTIVRQTAKLIPGYSGQRLMETSLAWDQSEDGRSDAARERAFENLRFRVADEDWKSFVNGGQRGVTWRFFRPAVGSVISLSLWTAFSLALAALGLRTERR